MYFIHMYTQYLLQNVN